ncbi:DUF1492 domain-containing protein [Lentilactobacillus otakiensis]|uniref:DUF1492 domain-containing protein n=1 Tax=Lentilactobacillus otakiensis TaxID=481720 RepID=UPI003D17FE1B
MEKQQKEFKQIMANNGYCAQIIASGNEQHCLYKLAVTTVSIVDAVVAEIAPQEQKIISMAYIEQWAPQLIMHKLGYGKSEYYRRKNNAINSVMRKITGNDVHHEVHPK